ncbi:MAG TPA: PadR family transcriptional regulator [Vicinamibacterales bacterium]|nr:PadR family transcriptional regulator [Vicinamibacterales bacterium]
MAGPQNDLKKGSAELMVLAVVEDQPRHGYDIARRIDESSGGLLRFHVASLYPMLYRMERRGWIAGRWIEKSGQRRRRYYRLTPAGRKVLAAQRREWQSLMSALDRVARISTV